jgi:hypothetical protein
MLKVALAVHHAKNICASVFNNCIRNPVWLSFKAKVEAFVNETGELPTGKAEGRLLDQAIDEISIESLTNFTKDADSRMLAAIEPLQSFKAGKERLKSFSRARIDRNDRRLLRRWILRKAGHRDHSSCSHCGVDTRPSVYHIQACLEVDIDKLCRQRLWNEAAPAIKAAVLACAPKAFFAAERVPKRAKKPPDRQESKRRKLI